MRILELIGQALRSVRSDESKLVEANAAVAAQPRTIQLTSAVFQDGQNLPKDYSADGEGHFPTISWSGVPENCQSLLLVVEDPDAPKATPFVHGIFYNIPSDLQTIAGEYVQPKGLTSELYERGVRYGINSVSRPTYMPPTPPPGLGPHHYHFQLMALDTVLDYPKEPSLADVKRDIENHVLASGEIVGIYER